MEAPHALAVAHITSSGSNSHPCRAQRVSSGQGRCQQTPGAQQPRGKATACLLCMLSCLSSELCTRPSHLRISPSFLLFTCNTDSGQRTHSWTWLFVLFVLFLQGISQPKPKSWCQTCVQTLTHRSPAKASPGAGGTQPHSAPFPARGHLGTEISSSPATPLIVLQWASAQLGPTTEQNRVQKPQLLPTCCTRNRFALRDGRSMGTASLNRSHQVIEWSNSCPSSAKPPSTTGMQLGFCNRSSMRYSDMATQVALCRKLQLTGRACTLTSCKEES